MCPSLWQVLQLYHWLNECDRVVEDDLALSLERQASWARPGESSATSLAVSASTTWIGVAQIVGDVEQVCRRGANASSVGRPPSADPAVPAVFLEQLGRDQVARAVRPARGAGSGRSGRS